MLHRLNHANELIRDSRAKITGLRKKYEDLLLQGDPASEPQISVKNILENLRSALDYMAREIYERLGTVQSDQKIYFPIAGRCAVKKDFRSVVGKCVPGLLDHHPEIVDFFASFQTFTDANNKWLPDMADLCNENKHEQLSPQRRVDETTRIGVRRVDAQVEANWDPRKVRFGGHVVVAGAPIDLKSQCPIAGPNHIVKREVSVDFQFAEDGMSILPFLETCASGVERILSSVDSFLKRYS